MKRLTAVALLVVLTTPALASALAGDKAAYVGGTIARFNMPTRRVEGRIEIGPRHFVFVPENSPRAAEPLCIDYESIRHLEFGQRASRRVPLVVAATAVLGPLGLMSAAGKEPCALPHADLRRRTRHEPRSWSSSWGNTWSARRWTSLKLARDPDRVPGRRGAKVEALNSIVASFWRAALLPCSICAAARPLRTHPAIPQFRSPLPFLRSCSRSGATRWPITTRSPSAKRRSRSFPGCARASGAMTASFPARRSRPAGEGRLW